MEIYLEYSATIRVWVKLHTIARHTLKHLSSGNVL
jgi:hypothetical protein